MASRGGPMVDGTDGTDFMHRQRVASQYLHSAVNKSRLRTCIFCHMILFFLMVSKLTPTLLDYLDVFVLELEELEVPKPLFWEIWWCVSILAAFIGLSAIRKNNVQYMQVYLGGILSNGVVPVIIGFAVHFSDVLTYWKTRSTTHIQVWQGYPYGILWYAFLILALQVHLFSIWFASKLTTAWRIKGSGKKGQ